MAAQVSDWFLPQPDFVRRIRRQQPLQTFQPPNLIGLIVRQVAKEFVYDGVSPLVVWQVGKEYIYDSATPATGTPLVFVVST